MEQAQRGVLIWGIGTILFLIAGSYCAYQFYRASQKEKRKS
jgi:hypothetical protein